MEETDTGWGTVLEKQGLHQGTHILEKYAIDGENDVSELDQNESSFWVNPFDVKKLKRWCEIVRARVEKMLPSWSTTPTTVSLVNSEAWTVM